MRPQRYLLQQARHRLQLAKPHLHLVPTLAQQHRMLSLQVSLCSGSGGLRFVSSAVLITRHERRLAGND